VPGRDRNHRIIYSMIAVYKMKMISPKMTTQSLKTEPRIKREIGCILCKVHVWKWPVAKYKHIKIKPRICVLFIFRLTWTVNANSLKQNIIVIKETCSWLPPFCKQNLLLFIQPRWQLRTYFFNHYNVLF